MFLPFTIPFICMCYILTLFYIILVTCIIFLPFTMLFILPLYIMVHMILQYSELNNYKIPLYQKCHLCVIWILILVAVALSFLSKLLVPTNRWYEQKNYMCHRDNDTLAQLPYNCYSQPNECHLFLNPASLLGWKNPGDTFQFFSDLLHTTKRV